MIYTWEPTLTISPELEDAVRAVAATKPSLMRGEVFKWGAHADFYIVKGAVKPHIDRRQQIDFVTQGFIVINDSDQHLIGNGLSLPMPPGSAYQLDGHELHGTEVPEGNNLDGLFAFLAWDIPVAEVLPLEQFAREALESVEMQFLKRTPTLQSARVYYSRSTAAQRKV